MNCIKNRPLFWICKNGETVSIGQFSVRVFLYVYIRTHIYIKIYMKDCASLAYLRITQLFLKLHQIAHRVGVVNRMGNCDELVTKWEFD